MDELNLTNFLSRRGFFRRPDIRSVGLRHGPRRLRRMASHHCAGSERPVDRVVRSRHPGLRHLAGAPGDKLADRLAVHRRRRARCSRRHRFADDRRSAHAPPRHGRSAGDLQPLQPRAAALKPVQGGVSRDFGVGIANGLIGGLTGLGGIAVTIWCQLRGGPKDAQRAIFQPVMFLTFLMSAISLRRGRRIHHRNAQAIRARATRPRCGHLAGDQTLWQAR